VFHEQGALHKLIKEKKIIIQPKALTKPPSGRRAGTPSLRIIDFGRTKGICCKRRVKDRWALPVIWDLRLSESNSDDDLNDLCCLFAEEVTCGAEEMIHSD